MIKILLIIISTILFFSQVAYPKDSKGLFEQLVGLAEKGHEINFNDEAKNFGFKNFSDAVKAYKKEFDVRISVEEAKKLFNDFLPEKEIKYTKENADRLFDVIINSKYKSAKRYKKKYLTWDAPNAYKAFAVTLNIEREFSRITKDPNIKSIAKHSWTWWSGPTKDSAVSRVMNACEADIKKYRIPFQECMVIDINGKNVLYEFIPHIKEAANKKKSEEKVLLIEKKKEQIKKQKAEEEEKKKAEEEKKQKAEEKRKEEERLAEEKLIEKEKQKEKELKKKLALIKTDELKENQNFIINVKSFVKKNPDVFDVVELAKKLIKVESILDGNLNDQNKADIQELKNFVSKSSKFNKFYNDLVQNEIKSKLNIIDNEILKLEQRVQQSKEYLINNLDSPYSNEKIEIIEKAENLLNNINDLNEIRFLIEEIDKLSDKIKTYEANILSLNEYQVLLKEYLIKYISTEISQPIINQSELIDKTLIEKNPENIKKLNKDIENFINDFIKKYEEKIDQEKKLKVEEKRKEEERLAEEKRKEEERLAEEKRKEEERLALEKKKLEEEKLNEIFNKYKAKSQFQKDLIRLLTKIPGIDIKKIKFSRGDKLIEADLSIKENNEFIIFKNISIKNFNKNVFNKLIKSFEEGKFDFSIFKEKKWFDEINTEEFSFNIGGINFASAINIGSFEFSKFIENRNLIENIGKKFNLDNDEINGFAALLSISVENLTFTNFSLAEKNGRYISTEYFDIEDFTILDWGRWTVKDYLDKDPNLNIITNYKYSYVKDINFDKDEIIKIGNSFNFEQLMLGTDNYNLLLNMIKSLGSGVTENITIRNLTTNDYIGGADSIYLKSLKFDYIDSEKKQKSLTEIDFSFNGINLNMYSGIDDLYDDYVRLSPIFTLMGYERVKFDFGANLKWTPSNNLLNFNLNLGITDAADLSLKSNFTGLSGDLFNTNNGAALGAYFLSNFKLKNLKLSLTDNSLRDKLIRVMAAESKMNTNDLKAYMISQIDNFTSVSSGNILFDQYKKSIKKFIYGSKKIELNIMPSLPISIAEVSPYFLSMTVNPDQLIEILNLSITN